MLNLVSVNCSRDITALKWEETRTLGVIEVATKFLNYNKKQFLLFFLFLGFESLIYDMEKQIDIDKLAIVFTDLPGEDHCNEDHCGEKIFDNEPVVFAELHKRCGRILTELPHSLSELGELVGSEVTSVGYIIGKTAYQTDNVDHYLVCGYDLIDSRDVPDFIRTHGHRFSMDLEPEELSDTRLDHIHRNREKILTVEQEQVLFVDGLFASLLASMYQVFMAGDTTKYGDLSKNLLKFIEVADTPFIEDLWFKCSHDIFSRWNGRDPKVGIKLLETCLIRDHGYNDTIKISRLQYGYVEKEVFDLLGYIVGLSNLNDITIDHCLESIKKGFEGGYRTYSRYCQEMMIDRPELMTL